MKPIKPRYTETVKVDWKIPKQSKLILSLYAKYTKYDEEYIIEQFINEIKDDAEFTKWLADRRYNKKVQRAIGETNDTKSNAGAVDEASQAGYAEVIEEGYPL